MSTKSDEKTDEKTDEEKTISNAEANARGVRILAEQGEDAVIEYLFTNPRTGQRMDYAESRMEFG